jgi:GNAT superfamily N-acetyltransferase
MKMEVATIRAVDRTDEAQWRRLWAEYLQFYQVGLGDEITDYTWMRLRENRPHIIGRVAEDRGRLVGFSISIIHEGTWILTPTCYLEDLYVESSARGHGVGTALIHDLIQLGHSANWSRIYWHTRAENTIARQVYDRFVKADGFIRYTITLK